MNFRTSLCLCIFFLCAFASNLLLGQSEIASPGSLFFPAGRLADSTRDLRASVVGDIVTIVVSDRASAIAKGVTNSSRKSSATNSIGALAGTFAKGSPLASLADLSNAQQIQSQGQTS